MLIVTDLDDARLKRAEKLLPPEEAKKLGVDLRFINTGSIENPVEYLRSLTGGEGFNDVFVYAPVKPVVEMGDALLARDGASTSSQVLQIPSSPLCSTSTTYTTFPLIS